jgi:hypothetical protein
MILFLLQCWHCFVDPPGSGGVLLPVSGVFFFIFQFMLSWPHKVLC